MVIVFLLIKWGGEHFISFPKLEILGGGVIVYEGVNFLKIHSFGGVLGWGCSRLQGTDQTWRKTQVSTKLNSKPTRDCVAILALPYTRPDLIETRVVHRVRILIVIYHIHNGHTVPYITWSCPADQRRQPLPDASVRHPRVRQWTRVPRRDPGVCG